ncbi:MAG: hypothetical protein HFJ65_03300 [Eggerthellaceae bacterium]|nr:hypothetical protein [Eggerthellaceae bacterium]
MTSEGEKAPPFSLDRPGVQEAIRVAEEKRRKRPVDLWEFDVHFICTQDTFDEILMVLKAHSIISKFWRRYPLTRGKVVEDGKE